MKFLVAIDGSDASAHALDRALLLARPSGAKLLLLSVVEPPADYFWPTVLPTGEPLPVQMPSHDELTAVRRSVALATLERNAARCRDAGVACELLIEVGAPRHVICDVAEREAVDIVVVGSRGLGDVQRLMLGSVSDYVVHHAAAPVLVVR